VDVEPGEIHRLERPNRRPARAEAVGEGAVDVREGADASVDERVGLPQERVLETVGDEARDGAADDHGRLAELLHPALERLERLERLGRGPLAADDLDELDELRRVQPVEAGEALGLPEHVCEGGERKRRRVRRQDRVRRELLGPRQHPAFRLGLLDDRLDHEVGSPQRFVGVGRQLHLRRPFAQPGASRLETRLAPGAEPHRDTGVGEDAGDAGTHRAGPHDGHFPWKVHRCQGNRPLDGGRRRVRTSRHRDSTPDDDGPQLPLQLLAPGFIFMGSPVLVASAIRSKVSPRREHVSRIASSDGASKKWKQVSSSGRKIEQM
jgi:hypothetical protein